MAAQAVAGVEETDNQKMQIMVVVPSPGSPRNRDTIALDVSSTDTLASLQARIRNIRGIPPWRQQRLVVSAYAWPPMLDPAKPDRPNGTAMAAEAADETGNITNRNMQIFVVLPRPSSVLNPNTIALEVSSNDTVASLKARLEEIDGEDRRIPTWRQRLVFDGSSLPDDDVMTLAELGVVHLSTVQLVETHMWVCVRDDRARDIYDLSSTDTVDTLKARYEAAEGVPADRQRLSSATWVELENGRTLADYDVRNGSWVNHRQLRWDQTHAFMALGRMLAMKVCGSDTVGHVKRTVKAKVGVPVAAQRAYHTNKSYELEDLEDGCTMEELGVMVRNCYEIWPPQLRIECPQEVLAGGAKEEEEAAPQGHLVPCRLFNGDLLEYYKRDARMRLASLKRRTARKEKLPYWRPPRRSAYRILHVFLEAPDPLLP